GVHRRLAAESEPLRLAGPRNLLLGHGPERARTWGGGGVIGAIIQLGNCLDLTDGKFTTGLRAMYRTLKQQARREGKVLAGNRGKRRGLDCLVINRLVESAEGGSGGRFQPARCPFLEGSPAFPGSAIRRDSHMQLVVFDKRCLLGVFRPVFVPRGG